MHRQNNLLDPPIVPAVHRHGMRHNRCARRAGSAAFQQPH
jgi:hypothetical protein